MRGRAQERALANTRSTPVFSGIGRRLGRLVAVFAVLVALFLAGIQAVVDRSEELALLDQRFQQIQDSNGAALALAVWNLDREQVELMLRGIKSLPDIHSVELHASGAGWFDEGRDLRMGAVEPNGDLIRETPLRVGQAADEQEIARLRLNFDAAAIEGRLRARAFRNLLSLVSLSLLMAGFLLWIVGRKVTRHLVGLADAAERFDPARSEVSFKLDRRRPGAPDELDKVAFALEAMRSNLEAAYRSLFVANEDLKRDVVAREEAERSSAHMARHDALTGLPNRRYLAEYLQPLVMAACRSGSQGALLFIDLDNFKQLNDARGHSIGDAVLNVIAQRLASTAADSGFAARMGGDEFVLVLPELSPQAGGAAQSASLLGEKLRCLIGEPIPIADEIFRLSASVGIAVFPSDGDNIESLIRHADTAMYQAKAEGGNIVQLFQPGLVVVVEHRHALEADVREALEFGRFRLHFQPIVDETGRLRGAEALLRWNHPSRGNVSPADFIPLCEESGLILELGRWVIRECLSIVKSWRSRDLFPDDCRVSINMSPRQFKQRDLVERLMAELEGADLTPESVTLEITEGTLMGDSEVALANLRQLKELGFRLLIDDFGVGFSSLSYLKRLPVHGIKIDRSFVRDIACDANDDALVGSLLEIGQRFGLEVIAEGVETFEHLQILEGHGCRRFQGFHFDAALPRELFETRWLQRAVRITGENTATLSTWNTHPEPLRHTPPSP